VRGTLTGVYMCLLHAQSDVQTWAQFMAVDGAGGSEHRVITLKYCEGACAWRSGREQAAC
jgi:hypothetical protein